MLKFFQPVSFCFVLARKLAQNQSVCLRIPALDAEVLNLINYGGKSQIFCVHVLL